jgi:hypothetical protein
VPSSRRAGQRASHVRLISGQTHEVEEPGGGSSILVVAQNIPGRRRSAIPEGRGSDIVGFARTVEEGVRLAIDLVPDVVVLDDQATLSASRDELSDLRRACAGASVFILTDVRGVLDLDIARIGPVAGFFNRARLGSRSGIPRG